METQSSSRKANFEPLSEKWFRQAGVKSLAKKHLLNSMASLEKGRDPTPSFKLYGKSDWSLVTDFFDSIDGKVDIPSWMKAYELSRESKFGPQGGLPKWEDLRADFELYQTRLSDVQQNSFIPGHYKGLNVSMLGISEALNSLKKQDKIETRAAGCPDFELKKTDEIAQTHAVKAVKSGEMFNYFGYVFSRFNKQKKRIFMPMPFASMIAQAQYYDPFLRRIQDDLKLKGADSKYTFWADKIGFDPCFSIATTLVNREYSLDSKGILVFVQRDFEKMDTTTGSSQYRELFIPCLAEAFNYKKGTVPYQTMERVMLMTTQMPIASPSGMMVGDHGTASGAEVTNGGETCCNDRYSAWAEEQLKEKCAQAGIRYKLLVNFGNGDDGFNIYLLENPKDLDKFKEIRDEVYAEAMRRFGFRGQPSKDLFSTEYGLYCQNMVWYEKDTVRNAYPASLIINSIVNPEKQYTPAQWDKDYRDLDVIQKLDNGKGLPYFKELVDFVDNGMKYHLLGKAESETRRILSKWDKYRALQPLSERFNRQDYDISTSPTVKYILEKRGYSK